jgi:hypothetical protein
MFHTCASICYRLKYSSKPVFAINASYFQCEQKLNDEWLTELD